jgi:hypothetical protein
VAVGLSDVTTHHIKAMQVVADQVVVVLEQIRVQAYLVLVILVAVVAVVEIILATVNTQAEMVVLVLCI